MKSRRSATTLSITIPQISLIQTVSDLRKKIILLASSISTFITNRLPERKKFSFSWPRFNRPRFTAFPIKRYIPLLLLILILGAIVAITINKLRIASSKDERIQVQGAKASMAINKELTFPLKDAAGKEVSKLKYFIEGADLRDEIIVKGQRAVAVKGRTFLILTIKLTNEYDKALDVNVRDYIRLSVNGNEQELLAADIHNDPVAVQAISTKNTRLGFPIKDTDKNLVLLVGEIKENKEKIALHLE